jgi:hypothetical protein
MAADRLSVFVGRQAIRSFRLDGLMWTSDDGFRDVLLMAASLRFRHAYAAPPDGNMESANAQRGPDVDMRAGTRRETLAISAA